MQTSDVTCSECRADFRRLELPFVVGDKAEFRCPACNNLLEVFDGTKLVAYRMTVQPTTRLLGA